MNVVQRHKVKYIYILTACISFADGLFTLLIPLIHCMVAAVMVVT